MNECLLQQISVILLLLHKGEREQSVEDFQDWALELIRPLMSFDSAFWCGSSVFPADAAMHQVHLVRQPGDMAGAGTEHNGLASDINDQMLIAAGRSTIFSHDSPMARGSDEPFWKQYGISQILGTYVHDSVTGLHHVLSLYRKETYPPFNEKDRLLHQFIVPHLIDAWNNNRILRLHSETNTPSSSQCRAAVADATGAMHFAQPGLVDLLREEWPHWRGPGLPPQLVEVFSSDSGAEIVGRTVVISIGALQDVFLVRIRLRREADSLTPRELEIAGLFARGETYKRIAIKLALAPSTVRNHLANVYAKLGADNKSDLARLIDNWK